MSLLRKTTAIAAAAILMSAPIASHATEVEIFGQTLKLSGSLGEGGFTRYVPSVLNPLFNETPFITTEVRALYAYHDVPDEFVTEGGVIQVAAAQLRLGLTERFGIIATSDGFTSIAFDELLEDDSGPNDIAFGFKYAAHYAPAAGEIATLGLRYTAPAGNLSTALGATEIELAGQGDGFINPFITAAKLFQEGSLAGLQIQGAAGFQLAISDENNSFFHGSLTANYELFPGFYPQLEANVFAPLGEGGDVFPEGSGLEFLTGAELVDIGAADPATITTLGGGFRWRPWNHGNVILGVGAEANINDRRNDTIYGYRVVSDIIVHF